MHFPNCLFKLALPLSLCLAVAAAVPDKTRVANLLRSQPLHFEPAPTAGQYAAQGPGYRLEVSATAARLQAQGADVQMSVVGGRTGASVRAEDKQAGVTHYLLGADERQWRKNVAHYTRVRVADVYQGIDLLYYGNPTELEYDFVVQPGADPNQIRLRFAGATELRIASNGDLLLTTPAGVWRQKAPVVYQERDGRRASVAGRYVRKSDREIGFNLARYDAKRPLVIDPRLEWSTYFGGAGYNTINDITIDSAGSLYVVGSTSSRDLPGASPDTTTRYGTDAFISKLNAIGTAVVYTTYFGASNENDEATAVEVDGVGNAYISGSAGRSFPLGPVGYRPSSGQSQTGGYVLKLNPQGDTVIFGALLCSDFCALTDVAISNGPSPIVYATGSVYSDSAFSPTPNAQQKTLVGSQDAFLAVLNNAGTSLTYGTYIGGTGSDYGYSVAVSLDNSKVAIVGVANWDTGGANRTFPTTPNAAQTAAIDNYQNSADGFVAIYSSASILEYASLIGGTLNDSAITTAFGPDSSLYIAGQSDSTDFLTTPGASQTVLGLGWVMKLQPVSWMRSFSTFVGGPTSVCTYYSACGPSSIMVSAGRITIAGSTTSDGFTATPGALQTSAADGSNAYLITLTEGGQETYRTLLGGSMFDQVGGLVIDSTGNAILVGSTFSNNFPIRQPALQHQLTQSGPSSNSKGWIAKVAFDQTVCTLTANISKLSFGPEAGNGFISISTPQGCVWQVSAANSYSAFPTFTTLTAGVGDGSVAFTVPANQTSDKREVFFSVGTVSYKLVQEGASCTYKLSNSQQVLSNSGGSATVSVSKISGCSLEVATVNDWIKIDTPYFIPWESTSTVSYTVSPNPGKTPRTGTITISGQTLTVTQVGNEAPMVEDVMPFAGQGISQMFSATWSDANGWVNLDKVYFHAAPTNALANSCHVEVTPGLNQVRLMNDDGVTWSAIGQLGASNTLANSQCSLTLSTSTASGAGNRFTANLAITFQTAYNSRLGLFLSAQDVSQQNSGRRVIGVWWPAARSAQAVERYRLFGTVTRGHLYTTDLNEYNVLGASGIWRQEGVTGKLLDRPGTFSGVAAVPFYRIYKEQSRTHFWTSDRNEYLTLIRLAGIYTGEGIDGFLLPTAAPGTVPLYRLVHQFEMPVLHHWTTDANEYNVLPGRGWRQEGVTGYLIQ